MSEGNSEPTKNPTLIAANIYFLQQAAQVMERLDRDAYTRTDPSYYESGLGKHFRHVLDHYTALLDGLSGGGRIDYDARARDSRLETDPSYARDFARACIAGLEELAAGNRDAGEELTSGHDLEVCSNGSAAGPGETWARSTLRRELQFLLSHTVHHYALIAVILRLQGHNPPPDFGVAPSTLEYQQQNHG